MNTCKTCAQWERNEESYQNTNLGSCGCTKFVENDDDNTPKDGVSFKDYEGYAAYLETGEDFGCIHWLERTNPSKQPENAS